MKASEHGAEYADGDENNKDPASEDGEPKDGEPTDGEPKDEESNDGEPKDGDGEPKGEFVSLVEDVPDKQMVEPQQDDPANTKSGCTMPAQEDMDRHMDEGRANF